MIEAAGQADTIDPAACRAWAEERFDVPRMVAEYEDAYQRLIDVGPAALLEATRMLP